MSLFRQQGHVLVNTPRNSSPRSALTLPFVEKIIPARSRRIPGRNLPMSLGQRVWAKLGGAADGIIGHKQHCPRQKPNACLLVRYVRNSWVVFQCKAGLFLLTEHGPVNRPAAISP